MKRYGRKKGVEIFRCKNCGFGETKGIDIQPGAYHRDEVYIEEEELFRNIFQKRVRIINKLIKPGKVLEVGCSTGLFLYLLKEKGWQTTGIEISKLSAEAARRRGMEIIAQKFEKVDFSEKFDLIIFNHTLEHLEDPIGILRKVKRLLLPKGYLYIDLPNFGGFSAKLFRTKWSLLLPEEHLWHFTEKALKLLLKDLEFKIIYTNKSSGIWDYNNPHKGLYKSITGFKKRFFKEIFTAVPSLILSRMGKGSDLMVIARKK